jgi:hypothetical protein
MAELMAFRRHRVSDGPQRLSLRPERDDLANSLLLGIMRDEIAVLAAPETERNLAAEIPAPRFLVGLHLSDPLPDAISLGLRKGGGDRQEQLRQAVASFWISYSERD